MDQRTKLINQLSDTKIQSDFSEFLNRSSDVDLGKLAEEVDGSDYSLDDWVEAFIGFDQWMNQQENPKVDRNFVHMLGYLHCCQMTLATTLNRPNLQQVVVECLNDYGYDAI